MAELAASLPEKVDEQLDKGDCLVRVKVEEICRIEHGRVVRSVPLVDGDSPYNPPLSEEARFLLRLAEGPEVTPEATDFTIKLDVVSVAVLRCDMCDVGHRGDRTLSCASMRVWWARRLAQSVNVSGYVARKST